METTRCESWTAINGVRMICDKPRGHNESCRMVLPFSGRDADRVPPQVETVIDGCPHVGGWGMHSWEFYDNPDAIECIWCLQKRPVNHATKPLVAPDRVTAIKAFRRSLALLEEAYGVKLSADTDGSKDLLILDTTRTIPRGYYYDARISEVGELDIADWILDEESGATRQ